MSTNRNGAGGRRRGRNSPASVLLVVLLVCALGFFVYQNYSSVDADISGRPSGTGTIPPGSSADAHGSEGKGNENIGNEGDGPDGETTPVPPTATPEPLPEFEPYSVDSTNPYNLLSSTGVMVNDSTVDSHNLAEPIDFGYGEDYTQVEGVITFRGNNFRDTAFYGTANIVNKTFEEKPWNIATGSLSAPNGAYWSGNGWTGQPLIVKWPKEKRAIMTNMHEWAREKEELVEVIYATMDGNIYFVELETGSRTRDDLFIGYTFKGAGSLDPRGYPILYVGAGYHSHRGNARAFAISLLDGSILYEFGASDPFSLRGTLSYFDGASLIDAETDQLIYPGESGILYIIKLNTVYNEAAGTLTMNPSDVVKWRYNGVRSASGNFWVGVETSPIIWRGHIIMADNGGNLMCLNLNTLEIVWVQDILDDSNSTPVLEFEDGHPYIYVSTSFHLGWRSSYEADVPVWKIDAMSGEVVWRHDFVCYSVSDLSGGAQASPAIGKNELKDLIFYSIARTPQIGMGKIVALNKHDGTIVWEKTTQIYSWSSPVAIYDENGKGYLIYCTTGGYMYLIDGLTGDILTNIDLGSNIEASPAVYNNIAVVGTRAAGFYGVKIT